jgi:hypothetical protein
MASSRVQSCLAIGTAGREDFLPKEKNAGGEGEAAGVEDVGFLRQD